MRTDKQDPNKTGRDHHTEEDHPTNNKRYRTPREQKKKHLTHHSATPHVNSPKKRAHEPPPVHNCPPRSAAWPRLPEEITLRGRKISPDGRAGQPFHTPGTSPEPGDGAGTANNWHRSGRTAAPRPRPFVTQS